MPEISVIMGVYNGADCLEESVGSLLRQTYTDFDVIVVDDASEDATQEILRGLAQKDSRLKIIRNDRNLGLTKSLNIASARAAGRYIARQDCGDLSLPDRFRKQIDFMSANPNLGLCGTGILIADACGKTIKAEPVVAGENTVLETLKSRNVFAHGSVMFRAEVLNQVGGYNEDYPFAQDYELFLRLAGKCSMDNLPEHLYIYKLSGSSISISRAYDQAFCALKARAFYLTGVEPLGDNLKQLQRDAAISATNDTARYHMLSGHRAKAFRGFLKSFLMSYRPVYLYRSVKSLISGVYS